MIYGFGKGELVLFTSATVGFRTPGLLQLLLSPGVSQAVSHSLLKYVVAIS